ncbi:hypothetical protein CLV75_0335 [Ruegeria conchae]|uniref:Uncharacterized protein n=1 Tax=Ruegeria conchae TaxID=981384 RepID=A0A498A3D6_9RHOB|nr:hypothetical protein CLV75_0335 [Ruegeria conchae]
MPLTPPSVSGPLHLGITNVADQMRSNNVKLEEMVNLSEDGLAFAQQYNAQDSTSGCNSLTLFGANTALIVHRYAHCAYFIDTYTRTQRLDRLRDTTLRGEIRRAVHVPFLC